jgi:hypothetical protein
MGELVAASGDESRWLFDDELSRFLHLLAGFLVAVDETRHDERLGLRAAVGEPAFDEEDVQTLAHAVRLACGGAPF